jgi:hypothetical protein
VIVKHWFQHGKVYDGRTVSWTAEAMTLQRGFGDWEFGRGTEWLLWQEIVGNMSWYEYDETALISQTFFAAAKIGAVLAVINPAYKEEELEFALRTIRTVSIHLRLTFRNKGVHYHSEA